MDAVTEVDARASRHSSETNARFWVKADRSGGPSACWLWTASRQTKCTAKILPYGHFKVGGKYGRTELAHRVAWELSRGRPVPAGKKVLHRCDNPPCVNPKHLFVGTQKQNVRDAIDKGRHNVRGLKGAK